MLRRILRRLLRSERNLASEPVAAPRPAAPAAPLPVGGIEERLRATIACAPVVLFMKGTPDAPRCGFSATVVGVLRSRGADFHSVDVLVDPAVRQGIKDLTEWPTIPQLFVDGEFIGGCDIVTQMDRDGSLTELLGASAAAAAPANPVSEAEVPDVHQTSPEVVAEWLAAGEDFVFLDVRTRHEFELAAVEGCELVTADRLLELEGLARDTRIAFLCHHGVRSQSAAMAFRSLGFRDLHNVVGGIEAWSTTVDPSVPRY